jgi:hypothetical protein
LPGRGPNHSAEAAALPALECAFHTLESSPAKPHHAAANVDREDDRAPGKFISRNILALQSELRLDDSLDQLLPFAGTAPNDHSGGIQTFLRAATV